MTDRPQKIVLVAYQCGPDSGSVAQIGWQWFKHLSQAGHAVTLVTHVRHQTDIESHPERPVNADMLFIDTEWLAGPLYRLSKRIFPKSEHGVFMLSQLDYFAFDWAACRQLKSRLKQSRDFDVIHIVTPVTTMTPSCLHRLGKPVIRGPLNCGLSMPKGFERILKNDSLGLTKFRWAPRLLDHLMGSLRGCAAILTATQATRASIPPSAQARCIAMMENAIDLSRFPPRPPLAPPQTGQALRVSFVGRLVAVKALDLLLHAIHQLRREGHQIALSVTGDGPMREAWQSLAIELGIADHVHWHGARPHAEIGQAMSESHVFCLPSIRESGGAVLLEAMACQRPVIAMNFGGPAEIVHDECGWLISAQDEEEAIRGLAKALRDALAHPSLCRTKGAAAREFVAQHHTWQARTRAVSDLYQMVTRRA